ncbi:hypothetical protein GUJ93_ZPchr0001g30652 [Zizania palustris]|uniref:LOB domain-containing protein n=1 Tax=Zizania palustris TaxID=103762 RepID=A0A8J5S7T7_ZIZPA|nr:hypothetical protein GUJ93_ZPchr0001g30652 [Zizania palustris]
MDSSASWEPPEPPQPSACAVCAHQKRRCNPGCHFAPFFPHDQQEIFRNVRRLFGVKGIARFMDAAGPEKLADAMDSIICEANAWAVDPVHGAYGVQLALGEVLRRFNAELATLQHELALCREQQPAQNAPPPPPLPDTPEDLGPGLLRLGPPQP